MYESVRYTIARAAMLDAQQIARLNKHARGSRSAWRLINEAEARVITAANALIMLATVDAA
ncbi:MAG TPA: hypothetical protein VGB05_10715 [Pyrinomonadaceae bacterium]